jgi:hypothetical protein
MTTPISQKEFCSSDWEDATIVTQIYKKALYEVEYEAHQHAWSFEEKKNTPFELGIAVHHRTLSYCPGQDIHIEGRK